MAHMGDIIDKVRNRININKNPRYKQGQYINAEIHTRNVGVYMQH